MLLKSLQTVLTPAVATKETFELYKRYQVAVHKDKPEKVTMRGFQRFLCNSPLLVSAWRNLCPPRTSLISLRNRRSSMTRGLIPRDYQRPTGHTTFVRFHRRPLRCYAFTTTRHPLTSPVYKVDSHLVGISVIDILPSCVSSVYFIWDPDWAWASLGKLSALREVGLVSEMARKGAKGMRWLYMGTSLT